MISLSVLLLLFIMFSQSYMSLPYLVLEYDQFCIRSRHQIPLLVLSRKFEQILFTLKPSENHRFSDDFRRNRSSLIRINSLDITSETWRWFLTRIWPKILKLIKLLYRFWPVVIAFNPKVGIASPKWCPVILRKCWHSL